jgi:hypothetical protein
MDAVLVIMFCSKNGSQPVTVNSSEDLYTERLRRVQPVTISFMSACFNIYNHVTYTERGI